MRRSAAAWTLPATLELVPEILRDGPMRNEPEYEALMNRALLRMGTGFRRLAVLMKSSVGMLQASRLRRERGGIAAALRAFQSEQEARDYLLAH